MVTARMKPDFWNVGSEDVLSLAGNVSSDDSFENEREVEEDTTQMCFQDACVPAVLCAETAFFS